MGGQQGIAGDLGSHAARAEDKVGEDRAYRFTRRALYPPDGDPTHTEADIMRVACETPSIATARLVCELKAEGEDEREHEFDERLAIAKQLKVGRFILKITSDGPVFAGLTGGVAHGSPSGQMVVADDDLRWGEDYTIARGSRGVLGLHH
jgi:hypothetical protein